MLYEVNMSESRLNQIGKSEQMSGRGSPIGRVFGRISPNKLHAAASQ
jgi:hypothetical protein